MKLLARFAAPLTAVVTLCALLLPARASAHLPATALPDEPQPASVVLIQETVFPDVEGGFNGMKIGYTVTGALLGEPSDWGSLRSYQGRLGTGALTVSGWVEQKSGYSASVSITVKVGDQEKNLYDSGGNPWRREFSLSLPIPAGETKGSFYIGMTGDYNAGDRWLSVSGDFAPENKVPVQVSGQVYTPLTHVNGNVGLPAAVQASRRAPLANLKVDLVRVEKDAQNHTTYRKLKGVMADADGKYWFSSVPVTTSLAISATLRSDDLAVYDASGSPKNYQALPTPASLVYAISQPFNVAGDKDLTVDLAFDSGSALTYPPAGSPLLQRLDHFGLVYYHTWQGIVLAQLLGVDMTSRPAPVYGYLPDRSAYWYGPGSDGGNDAIPPHIVIGAALRGGVPNSDGNSSNRPDNREWHEFGHYFMADAFSDKMPRDGLPRNNHHGYKNESTSDSWTEGFAEFFSLLVNREIAKDGTPPHIYHWAGSAINVEANWRSWTFRNTQSYEEFAVASLLWDLLDPADAKDITVLVGGDPAQVTYADRVEVDLPTLWTYLAHNRGGAYGYNLHVQHLYEILKTSGVGATKRADGMTALDELFIAHGFFADIDANHKYYNAGETVGTTGYLAYNVGNTQIPERKQRKSPPPVPDAYVQLQVVDEAGKPLTVTQYDVDVRFKAPYQSYNFSYEANTFDNRLFFLPAPVEYPATISVKPHGVKVDEPLVLSNEFVWTAPADENGVIKKHTFTGSSLGSLYLPSMMKEAGPAQPAQSDSFCNAGSGWPSNDTAAYSLHYLSGPPCQYQVRINAENEMAAATANWQAQDYTLESLVRFATGKAGGAGLLVGLNNDWSRFYVFGIGSNGKYWLSKNQGGKWTPVAPRVVTDKLVANGENRLKLVSQGGRFSIYLNGSLLTSVDDGESHAGRVGLYAEGLAGFDARFRDLKLWTETASGAGESAIEVDQWDGPSTMEWLGP